MKFTIPREFWLRGCLVDKDPDDPSFGSYLLRESDQRQCCLGHLLMACNIPKETMINVATPGDLIPEFLLSNSKNLIPDFLVDLDDVENDVLNIENEKSDYNSQAARELMEANDRTVLFGDGYPMRNIDDEYRENEVAKLLKENGFEVEFTGPRLPKIDGIEVAYNDPRLQEKDVK